MLKLVIKTAFRNLSRNRVYSLINIIGLAIGLAGFILVLLFLNYELSFDRWDPALDKVYKISMRNDDEVQEQTPSPLGRFLASNSPVIEAASTIQPAGEVEVPLSSGDQKIYAKGSVEVDSLFLRVFPYKLSIGDPSTALNKPNAILISKDLSSKLFGNENPIGKTIKIFNAFENEVTGVMEQPSTPSHLNVQFAWRSPYETQNHFWENQSYQTYVKTKSALSVSKLDAIINPLYYNQRLKQGNKSLETFRAEGHQAGLFADAVHQIHNFPRHGSSQFSTIAVLLILAFLLLLAGAINFSNLSIASSMRRAREVGIRKTLGSGKGQLMLQFMSETTIQCVISLLLALFAVKLLLPYFSSSFDIQHNVLQVGRGLSIGLQVAICLIVVILLSGLYPAIFLSVLNPSKVLKGEFTRGNKGRNFRNGLIIIQFIVAAFFVFGTIVIHRQIKYLQDRDKGFDADMVVRIQAMQRTRDADFENTRQALLKIPGVVSVSKSTLVPGDRDADSSTYTFRYDGGAHRMASVKVSKDYFSTLGISLKSGRLFDDRLVDQRTKTAVINETAAKMFGSFNPIGKSIYFPECDSLPIQVVGIVRDMVVQGFEYAVQPVAYTIGNNSCMFQSGGAILVKVDRNRVASTIGGMQQTWKQIEPDMPLRYSFLDENFARLYASYTRLQTVVGVFTVMAILISLVGLFAMTAYLSSQRNKEIGVRKVLGASVADVAALLGKDFLKLVLVGTIVATPLSYWAMNQWLETFAYRISLHWGLFAISAIVLILVATVTIGFQTIRAALTNPVKSLRSD